MTEWLTDGTWLLLELGAKSTFVLVVIALAIRVLGRAAVSDKRLALLIATAVLVAVTASVLLLPAQLKVPVFPDVRVAFGSAPLAHTAEPTALASPASVVVAEAEVEAPESAGGPGLSRQVRQQRDVTQRRVDRRRVAVNWAEIALVSIWGFGFLLQLARATCSLATLGQIRRTSIPVDTARIPGLSNESRVAGPGGIASRLATGVEIVENPSVAAPISFGIVRPTIVVPVLPDVRPEELRHVILHEMIHIRNRDFLLALVIRFLGCLHWYNPLFWRFARRAEHLQELSCDQGVIEAGVDRSDYCESLVSQMRRAVQRQTDLACPVVRGFGVKERVRALMAPDERNARRWSSGLVLVVVLVAAVLTALSGCSPPQRSLDAENRAVPAVRFPEDPRERLAQLAFVGEIPPEYVDLGEVLLTDEQPTRVPLPPNVLPLEAVVLTADVYDSYFLVDGEVEWDGEGIEMRKNVLGLYHSGGGIAFDTHDWYLLFGISRGERIPPDQIRATLSLAIISAEQFDEPVPAAYMEELEEQSHSSTAGLVQYQLELMHDRIMQYQHDLLQELYPYELPSFEDLAGDEEWLGRYMFLDPYSPNRKPYRFEAVRRYFVISSVGPDGIEGTDDDPLLWYFDRVSYGSYGGNTTRGDLWDDAAGTWIPLLAFGRR